MTTISDFFTLFAGTGPEPFGAMWMYLIILFASFILMLGIIDILFQVVKLWKS